MKKLMYLLFAAGTLFMFTACAGGSTTEEVTEEAVETVATCCCGHDACAGECHTDAEVTEKVGCQVEGGECLADHSCCAEKSDHEGHDHEGHDHEGHNH